MAQRIQSGMRRMYTLRRRPMRKAKINVTVPVVHELNQHSCGFCVCVCVCAFDSKAAAYTFSSISLTNGKKK